MYWPETTVATNGSSPHRSFGTDWSCIAKHKKQFVYDNNLACPIEGIMTRMIFLIVGPISRYSLQ